MKREAGHCCQCPSGDRDQGAPGRRPHASPGGGVLAARELPPPRHGLRFFVQARVKPASSWRRGGEIAGWIVSSVTLVLMPKCPLCLAAYVALYSGIGISIASASRLRTGVMALCVAMLLGLAVKYLRRLAWRRG